MLRRDPCGGENVGSDGFATGRASKPSAWDDERRMIEDRERLEALRSMHSNHVRAARAIEQVALVALSRLDPETTSAADVARLLLDLGTRLERLTLSTSGRGAPGSTAGRRARRPAGSDRRRADRLRPTSLAARRTLTKRNPSGRATTLVSPWPDPSTCQISLTPRLMKSRSGSRTSPSRGSRTSMPDCFGNEYALNIRRLRVVPGPTSLSRTSRTSVFVPHFPPFSSYSPTRA